MAYTDPSTETPGTIAQANIWNTYVRDNFRALRSPESIHHIGSTPFERWYPLGLGVVSAPTGGVTWTINTLYSWPFVIARSGAAIDRLSINCLTAAGGALARVGIYSATSATNIYPLNLVVDSGAYDLSATGVKTATVSTVLTPHMLYWVCYVTNSATASTRGITGANLLPFLGGPTTMGTSADNSLTPSFTYGALPSTYPTGATPLNTATVPFVATRFSA